MKETKSDSPYVVGKSYFIRTVTHHYTGKLVAIYPGELVLEDVAWIADDGRFADALETGEFSEIEPYPDGEVILSRGAVLDVSEYKFPLPRYQK